MTLLTHQYADPRRNYLRAAKAASIPLEFPNLCSSYGFFTCMISTQAKSTTNTSDTLKKIVLGLKNLATAYSSSLIPFFPTHIIK